MNSFVPYSHPTTVVLIDDNCRFMKSLSFGLGSLPIKFKLFTNAKKALDWINTNHPTPPYLPVMNSDDAPMHTFADRMYDPNRFNEVAIIIVDYDMPDMNGIVLCELIKNDLIKKILLTGVAEDSTALDAFNHDIIDRFIVKQHEDTLKEIRNYVISSQHCYFRDKSASLKHQALKKTFLPFLKEPGLKKIFDTMYAQDDYVEYYTNFMPDGIWMIKSNGKSDFLVMQSDAMFADQLEIASDDDGPETLLKELHRDDIVACFLDNFGYYDSSCNWQAALHPATRFEGIEENFRYTLLKGIPPKNRNALDRISFNDFLRL